MPDASFMTAMQTIAMHLFIVTFQSCQVDKGQPCEKNITKICMSTNSPLHGFGHIFLRVRPKTSLQNLLDAGITHNMSHLISEVWSMTLDSPV